MKYLIIINYTNYILNSNTITNRKAILIKIDLVNHLLCNLSIHISSTHVIIFTYSIIICNYYHLLHLIFYRHYFVQFIRKIKKISSLESK